MLKQVELLHCPFCGQQAREKSRLTHDFGVDHKFIECGSCGAKSKGYLHGAHLKPAVTPEDIAGQWNKRKSLPELRLYRLRCALAAACDRIENRDLEEINLDFVANEIVKALDADLMITAAYTKSCNLCGEPVTEANARELDRIANGGAGQ
jgi:hypothetical protein